MEFRYKTSSLCTSLPEAEELDAIPVKAERKRKDLTEYRYNNTNYTNNKNDQLGSAET